MRFGLPPTEFSGSSGCIYAFIRRRTFGGDTKAACLGGLQLGQVEFVRAVLVLNGEGGLKTTPKRVMQVDLWLRNKLALSCVRDREVNEIQRSWCFRSHEPVWYVGIGKHLAYFGQVTTGVRRIPPAIGLAT